MLRTVLLIAKDVRILSELHKKVLITCMSNCCSLDQTDFSVYRAFMHLKTKVTKLMQSEFFNIFYDFSKLFESKLYEKVPSSKNSN